MYPIRNILWISIAGCVQVMPNYQRGNLSASFQKSFRRKQKLHRSSECNRFWELCPRGGQHANYGFLPWCLAFGMTLAGPGGAVCFSFVFLDVNVEMLMHCQFVCQSTDRPNNEPMPPANQPSKIISLPSSLASLLQPSLSIHIAVDLQDRHETSDMDYWCDLLNKRTNGPSKQRIHKPLKQITYQSR